MNLETAKQAVVTVGGGRGFILNTDQRLIITAAHCLPHLPPAHRSVLPGMYLQERNYKDMVGHIGEDQQKIGAKCLFADPVADIAVLGEPDGEVHFDQVEAYEDFVTKLPALEIGWLSTYHPNVQGMAWLLGLGGEWGGCQIRSKRFGSLWITEAVEGIVGGMSGSPILNTAYEAVGVVSTSGGSLNTPHTEGGPQASLRYNLPGWVLASLK